MPQRGGKAAAPSSDSVRTDANAPHINAARFPCAVTLRGAFSRGPREDTQMGGSPLPSQAPRRAAEQPSG